MDGESERRGFPRLGGPVEVVLAVGGADSVDGTLQDLSLSGAYVACEAAIPEGMDLRVVFYLDGREAGQTFDASARVVRSDPGGVGLEFTGVKVEAFRRLQQLVGEEPRPSDS